MNECKYCGSALEGNPLASEWRCSYCKTVNYNEEYLALYARSIDFSKTHNLLQVGMAAFEGRDYSRAREAFERVLMEDSRCREAWVYGAACVASLSDLSTIDRSIANVESYLNKARELAQDGALLGVGQSVARNAMGRTLLRAVRRHRELAEKNYFAYESVNHGKAVRERDEELRGVIRYAQHAFAHPPDDPAILGPIAVEVLLACRTGGCPPQLKKSADAVLEQIRQKNPDLFHRLTAPLKSAKRKSGCLGSVPAMLLITLTDAVCRQQS